MGKVWVAALAVIAALCVGACAEETDSGGSDESEAAQGSTSDGGDEKERCGTRATEDCTPDVSAKKKVRVDALIWQITDARSATELGDPQLLGETADGTFVIVDLKVRSDKDESATLTSNVVQLVAPGGETYDTDTDGTVAALGADEDPFFLEDIGPDSTVSGTVVFDVPSKLIGKKLKLRFNELGFGSTHGLIRVPKL